MALPLYSVATLRAVEARAAAPLPPGTLMQRAGAAAAAWIDARLPRRDARVLVICGPGNNGGDGYVCAAGLRARAHRVDCIALAPAQAADARAAQSQWAAAGGTVSSAWPPPDGKVDAVVDAMFGIGLARPLADTYLQAAHWMRDCGAPVYALDVPSGLDADTGAWVGGVRGVEAGATITFLGAKPGLYTADGVDAAGVVHVDTLGIDPGAADGHLNDPSEFPALLARRPRNSHKGRFGNVQIVGGAPGMVGAALLAARAALRLGAGRVYVECLDESAPRVDPLQPELMFRSSGELLDLNARVIGCGLGTTGHAPAAVGMALAQSEKVPVVIDADALNLIADTPALRNRAEAAPGLRVLTPHPLEAARLLGSSAAQVQADRAAAARSLAQQFASIVVLKGAGSIVATPPGRWWINPTGGPALATAGTGDVLAGMIGAFLAQGFDPVQAVLAGTWLHGRGADDFGADVGLAAGDIAPLAARALARLREGSGSA